MAEYETLTEALLGLIAEPPTGTEVLPEIIQEARPEDLADALLRLEREERILVLNYVDGDRASQVLVELPTEEARALLTQLPDPVIAHFLDILPMDDAVDLWEELEPERFHRLLTMIPVEDAQEIRRLLEHPEGSVGRLMTERFFWSPPTSTMSQLLLDLRQASDEKYESVNDVFVLDRKGMLVGVFSLRRLLRSNPYAVAEDVMRSDVITANVKEPAEDAARRMSRYGFYALPVVDDRGRMVGIFTGDDAQTVLREEDTRDVLALGGVSGDGDSYLGSNVWSLFRRRIVWLLALFIAETVTGMVLRHYGQNGGEDLKLNPLIFFVPLLIGAGGNVGSQVTTTITRALALGEVGTRDAVRVLRRELVVATLIGLTLGAVGFARAFFGWSSGFGMSAVVGIALPAIVIWSASVGSLLPLATKRLGIDPAVMSAPFISTFVDATGLIIYFEIAQWFVRAGWLTITV